MSISMCLSPTSVIKTPPKMSKKHTVCINCGYYGHTSKNCNFPVTSYGILCFHRDSAGKIRYLMVQRKDSLAYVDFIRGKYPLGNVDYIRHLISNMTKSEQQNLLTHDFRKLWNNMWGVSSHINHNLHKKDYEVSKKMFITLTNGFYLKVKDSNEGDVVFTRLEDIVNGLTRIAFDETEWEFPKGRRMLYEDDFLCAKREFFEETGVNPGNVLWLSMKSFDEIYTGSNGIRYRNIYFIAQYIGDIERISKLTLGNKQREEVRDISWISAEDVSAKIRATYIERKELIPRVTAFVNKLIF